MYKWLIYILIATSVVGFGIWYVRYNNEKQAQYQEQIASLKANNSILVDTLSSNTEQLNNLTKSYDTIRQNFDQINQQFKDMVAQNAILKDKFDQHDLKALALAKPDLIEKIINRSSVEAIRCFEILSGAPLKEREANAKNGNEFNKECPWLFDNFINNQLH